MNALTITGGRVDGVDAGLRCEDGLICAIGPELTPLPGDEVIDASGGEILPALVNGHTHAAMTLFRGYGGDLPLMRWLQERIWPAEARLEADDAYWGVRLACAEMIRSGTARFWDMYWHPEATARAVQDSGLRATIGAPLIDGEIGGDLRKSALRSLDLLDEAGPLVRPALAPHAIYTVGEDSLRWISGLSAERGLPVQIHLSETEREVSDCVAEHGLRPAAYLDRCGLLNERTVLAHGVWLDRAELELIAERGTTVITNPAANMKLAVGGAFPWPEAKRAGVAVGLGTDGAGSNDSLDLLADLKLFALVQKHQARDAEALTAPDAWRVATGALAPALGASGDLAVGNAADLIVLSSSAPELTPGDLTEALVYAASGSVVDTTVVAGRVLMRNGEVPERAEIIARVAESAVRLGLS